MQLSRLMFLLSFLLAMFTIDSVSQPNWVKKASLPAGIRVTFTGASPALIDGKLYVLGRISANRSNVLAYDPLINEWNMVATVPVGLVSAFSHSSFVGFEGKLFIFGGWSNCDRMQPNAGVFDPNTGEWKDLPPMPTPRGGFSVAVHNGMIYTVGGFKSTDCETKTLNVTEVFDPRENRWIEGPP